MKEVRLLFIYKNEIGTKLRAVAAILLPPWMVRPGLRLKPITTLQLDKVPQLGEPLIGAKTGTTIDCALLSSLALSREISLPLAAQANLNRVIDLQIRQNSPTNASDLIWGHKIVKRDKSTLTVCVYIFKKTVLDRILDAASKSRVQVRKIVLISNSRLVATFVDNSKQMNSATRIWGVATLATLLASIGYFSFVAFQNDKMAEIELSRLANQYEELQARAIELKNQKETGALNTALVSSDLQAFRVDHSPLPFFIALTTILPDTVWISGISLSNGRVRLSGFSSLEVSRVLEMIQSLDVIKSVALDGQISFDRLSNMNRFDALAQFHIPKALIE